MTNIEQEFFKTFGIEKICVRGCGEYYLEQGITDIWEKANCKECKTKTKCEYDKSIWKYPQITDRVLLELMCLCTYYTGFKLHNLLIKNPYELKVFTLQDIMLWYSKREFNHEKCKEQIQSLFREGEE